jgi:general L-amino acid transport system permease protein
MSDLSYVRTEMLGEQEPPLGETGILKWMRENLFSSYGNGALTIISVVFLYYVLNFILPWMFQSSWTANSLGECREQIAAAYGEGTDGACWAVIRERYKQLLFGFYPSDLYWRPIIAFFLLGFAIAPVLFDKLPRKMLIFSGLFPFIAFWLVWGGTLWTPVGALLGFVIGYLASKFLPPLIGALGATISTFLLPVIWWIFLFGPIGAALAVYVGDNNMDSAIAGYEQRIASGEMDAAELVTAKRELQTLRSLPDKKAELAGLEVEAEKLRAALPDYLADIKTPENLPIGTTKEDKVAFEKLLDIESREVGIRDAIQRIYEDVGRIGPMVPVASDQLGGFTLSVLIGITGIVVSLPLGILLALGRQSDLFVVKTICVGFIEFIRGVPLITLLFVASTLLNYFMPPGTSFDLILRVMIMVTLFSAAYMAEVIRGGLAALPKGQYEAADALGMDYWQSTRLIIMPQALKISIPNIVSSFIGLFKDTTLVMIVGLMDPMGLSNAIRANQAWNGIVWELYGFIALMFWIVCFSMSRYSMYLERKLQTGH